MTNSLSQLRQASFRGAAFQVEMLEDDYGRRTVTHTYPNYDGTYTEDLGKSPDGFQVEGYVTGEDYIAQAEKLIKACKKSGSGLLVHPWLGSMTVICQGCRPSWSHRHLRECRLRMTFQEEGVRQYPSDNADYAALASDTMAGALETFTLKFKDVFSSSGADWVTEDLAAVITRALTLMKQVASVAGIGSDGLGDLLDSVTDAVNNAGGLAADGDGLADAVTDITGKITTTLSGADPDDALESVLSLADFSANLTAEANATASAKTLADSATAFSDLVDRLALSSGIKLALDADYGAKSDALTAKKRLVSTLDSLMESASGSGDHDSFEALRELQVRVVDAMDEKIGGLPGLSTVKISPAVTPALALSYDLYRDLGREPEILTRNPEVVHPGFLPGGDTLEVADA